MTWRNSLRPLERNRQLYTHANRSSFTPRRPETNGPANVQACSINSCVAGRLPKLGVRDLAELVQVRPPRHHTADTGHAQRIRIEADQRGGDLFPIDDHRPGVVRSED